MDPLSVLSLIVGIIGTATAVYQTAVINENKKTKGELQFLLAGINSSAIQKMQSWQNQIDLTPPPTNEKDLEILKLKVSARDEFTDLANLTTSLEGAIDSADSAILKMMKKHKETVVLNNEIQDNVPKTTSKEDVGI